MNKRQEKRMIEQSRFIVGDLFYHHIPENPQSIEVAIEQATKLLEDLELAKRLGVERGMEMNMSIFSARRRVGDEITDHLVNELIKENIR